METRKLSHGFEKSNGHIAFFQLAYSGQWKELIHYPQGESVLLAPVENAIDVDTGIRHAVFDCYDHSMESRIDYLKSQSTVWED